MNLQIVSDSINRIGGTNYTNEFTMTLSEMIDAENNDIHLRVLNVAYPLTIKNVLDKDCSFRVKITFVNPKGNTYPGEITFDTEEMTLPDGIYTLDKLIAALNSYLEEYDIIVERTREGKIGIHFNFDYEYWVQQFKSSSGFAFDGHDLGAFHRSNSRDGLALQLSFTMSEKLQYMLGLDQVEFNSQYNAYWGKNLPDIMDGVNKIFIYCDQVEDSIVGDSMSRLLAVVPIELDGQGSGELFTYAPVGVRRKLIKSKITELHISMRDSSGRLIPFSAGTVNIECALEV